MRWTWAWQLTRAPADWAAHVLNAVAAFGKLVGHLRQGLCGCDSDAVGYSRPSEHLGRQLPCELDHFRDSRHINEALIDAVNLHPRRCIQSLRSTLGQFRILGTNPLRCARRRPGIAEISCQRRSKRVCTLRMHPHAARAPLPGRNTLRRLSLQSQRAELPITLRTNLSAMS